MKSEQITKEWLKERAALYSNAPDKLGRQNIVKVTHQTMQASGLDHDQISDLINQIVTEVRSMSNDRP